MSITRAQIAVHLHYQFSTLATEIGQAATDESATGYGPDIDQAYRRLGTAAADLSSATVADADTPAALALAEYYSLARFGRQLALRADVGAGSLSQRLGKQADTLAALTVQAAKKAAGLGYPVDAAPAWSLGSINLDYLEPEPTT
jgi:hypothetical protein